MEDETLFNDHFWYQIVALIGLHFQEKPEEDFIKSKLENLINKNKTIYLICSIKFSESNSKTSFP